MSRRVFEALRGGQSCRHKSPMRVMSKIYTAAVCVCASATAFADTYVVTNTNDSGAGSLRAAINQANNHPNTFQSDPDVIAFNIEGSGVHRIAPLTELPSITDAVIIDGYTQPGTSVNTAAHADNAVLLIELNGEQCRGSEGLTLRAQTAVRGLVINGFRRYGIYAEDGDGHVIEGNFIGTDAAGLSALGNGTGLLLTGETTVGGPSSASRNIISGNVSDHGGNHAVGIHLGSGPATIQGNFIGVDATGSAALPNEGPGIFVTGDARIGSAQPRATNVISGNRGDGILLSHGIVEIVGNRIGTNAAGTKPVPNHENGILSYASGTQVGLMQNGFETQRSPNTIAYNGKAGIALVFGTGVTISQNRIFGNGGLAIDLGIDQVTANDDGDPDRGANGLQNFPRLTSAAADAGTITIAGSLNSRANRTYRLEFFASGGADPSGFGESRYFLGSADVTTGSGGHAAVSVAFPFGTTKAKWVTATATAPNGSTSEFSRAVEITTPDQPDEPHAESPAAGEL